MRKMFHNFSINNKKRKINITKLDYNYKLYDKDIEKIFWKFIIINLLKTKYL